MYCALKNPTHTEVYTVEQLLSVRLDIRDKTGLLQGNKLGSVSSRTTSIKLILHSPFMSKAVGGADIWRQRYVLKLFFCLETSALFQ